MDACQKIPEGIWRDASRWGDTAIKEKGKGMENSDANGIFQEGEKGLEKPVWYRVLSKKGLVSQIR